MHEALYNEALEAIQKVMFDKSVSPETAAESLRTLQSEIEIMLEALGQ